MLAHKHHKHYRGFYPTLDPDWDDDCRCGELVETILDGKCIGGTTIGSLSEEKTAQCSRPYRRRQFDIQEFGVYGQSETVKKEDHIDKITNCINVFAHNAALIDELITKKLNGKKIDYEEYVGLYIELNNIGSPCPQCGGFIKLRASALLRQGIIALNYACEKCDFNFPLYATPECRW